MMSTTQMEKWNRWHELDPERNIHSPDLYAMWAAKQEIVTAAIAMQHADCYIWCDAGSFRCTRNGSFQYTHRYTLPGKITCLRINDTIGGGVLAGDKKAWRLFSTHYLTELDRNLHGSDQTMMNRFLNDTNAIIIKASSHYGDPWFYLSSLFSSASKFRFDVIHSASFDSADIDHIIYINLAHRTDRKRQLEQQMSILPSDKITRLEAVLDKRMDGHVGCCRSHIAALQLAISNNWDNVLIVEDDAVWSDLGQFSLLATLASEPYDVIVLGGTFADMHDNFRLKKCHSTASYLLKNAYLSKLLQVYENSLIKLVNPAGTDPKAIIDVAWQALQEKDNWYLVYPPLMIQGAGYSDICNSIVAYEKFYSVDSIETNKTTRIKKKGRKGNHWPNTNPSLLK